ncbi:anti-sigma factor family protein [Ferruginibacter sp.]|nr:hypothetical protein [Ferruginibacter sp.]
MNINRHNYEEFFLLYVDNELSAAERNAVEVFVQENADLKEELLMLQQTIFNSDAVVFENKHTLLKEEITPLQENLLLYIDGELNAAAKLNMQQLLAADAAANKEFTVLQQTKLQADTAIVFPDKKILYKKEKGRVVGMPWFRIAAAAILLGFGTWATVSVVNNITKAGDVNDVAKKTDIKTTPVISNIVDTAIGQTEKNSSTNVNTAATNNTGSTNTGSKKNIPAVQNNVQQILRTVKDNSSIALEKENKKPSNNLPQPVYNNFNNSEGNKTAIAIVPPTERANIDINSGNKVEVAQQVDKANTAILNGYALNTNFTQGNDEETNNDKVLYMKEDNVKKSKLGGLFRKVKRLVERNANIKTGNGIKIAGFDIAIK